MLVRRSRLEKAEAETSAVLAQLDLAVAAARNALAQLQHAVKTCSDWEAMYDEKTAALKKAEGERDLALWVIRVPGMETGGPPTCIGTYDPNGH